MFQGQSIRLRSLAEGFVEMCFDRVGERVNKLDHRTLAELLEATRLIHSHSQVRGVVISSGKEGFVAGADIGEFNELFGLPEEELVQRNLKSNEALTAIECLPVPVVVAINGYALGGGLELALAADLRVGATTAPLGLPEVKLGLFPGLGGTVRLPRVAGTRVALEWITDGAPRSAQAALDAGVLDAVSAPEDLSSSAISLLREAIAAPARWRERRAVKEAPVVTEARLFDDVQRSLRALPHQPAALEAIELLRKSVLATRDQALTLEARAFARIAKTQAADALVQIFLNDQWLKKKAKSRANQAEPVGHAAVVGAGIMGGGIACACAMRGIPVRMKDIDESPLQVGLTEARKVFAKKLGDQGLEAAMRLIHPQLDYTGFNEVDLVVEAVVESLDVKRKVFAEIEQATRDDAVLASNTSSLRIDDLATRLERPDRFVGLHFFNPVPVMPLVEVIRGTRTSEAAVARVVRFATTLGKTPVVVRDGPGFLVNRVLTPYMKAFARLIIEGADFEQVDRVMEAFGWPMGPAYLNDVVGLDTAAKVADTIGAGLPERLARYSPDPLEVLVQAGRLGQKNDLGFYRYEPDARGKPRKLAAPEAHELLGRIQKNPRRTFTDSEIVERMMLPMMLEAILCLRESVVDSAPELDMAMLLGVGFPQYLGGPLKYTDWLGAGHVAARLEHHGYVTPSWLKSSGRFYGSVSSSGDSRPAPQSAAAVGG